MDSEHKIRRLPELLTSVLLSGSLSSTTLKNRNKGINEIGCSISHEASVRSASKLNQCVAEEIYMVPQNQTKSSKFNKSNSHPKPVNYPSSMYVPYIPFIIIMNWAFCCCQCLSLHLCFRCSIPSWLRKKVFFLHMENCFYQTKKSKQSQTSKSHKINYQSTKALSKFTCRSRQAAFEH